MSKSYLSKKNVKSWDKVTYVLRKDNCGLGNNHPPHLVEQSTYDLYPKSVKTWFRLNKYKRSVLELSRIVYEVCVEAGAWGPAESWKLRTKKQEVGRHRDAPRKFREGGKGSSAPGEAVPEGPTVDVESFDAWPCAPSTDAGLQCLPGTEGPPCLLPWLASSLSLQSGVVRSQNERKGADDTINITFLPL